MSRRVLVTGADTFWGGRMIQALETDPSMDVILGMGTQAPSVPVRAGRVRPGRPELLHLEPDREGDPGRHDPPHVHDHELDHGAPARHARDQRDRDDEPPGRRRGRRLVGAPHRGQVVDAGLRLRGQRPEHVPRGHAADQPGEEQRRARPRRGRGAGARLLGGQPRHQGDRAALRQRPRHAPDHADQPQPGAAASARPSSASTHSCSSSRRTTSCGPWCTSPTAASRASTTSPGTGGSPGARWPASAAPAWCPLSPCSPLKLRPAGPAVRPPRRARGPAALRARSRHAPVRLDRLHLQRDERGRRAEVHPSRAAAPAVRAAAARRTPTSTTSSSSSATRRRSSAPATSDLSGPATPPPALLPHRPFLGRDGVPHVVLPDAVDLEEAQRDAFLADAELLDHAAGWPGSAG